MALTVLLFTSRIYLVRAVSITVFDKKKLKIEKVYIFHVRFFSLLLERKTKIHFLPDSRLLLNWASLMTPTRWKHIYGAPAVNVTQGHF